MANPQNCKKDPPVLMIRTRLNPSLQFLGSNKPPFPNSGPRNSGGASQTSGEVSPGFFTKKPATEEASSCEEFEEDAGHHFFGRLPNTVFGLAILQGLGWLSFCENQGLKQSPSKSSHTHNENPNQDESNENPKPDPVASFLALVLMFLFVFYEAAIVFLPVLLQGSVLWFLWFSLQGIWNISEPSDPRSGLCDKESAFEMQVALLTIFLVYSRKAIRNVLLKFCVIFFSKRMYNNKKKVFTSSKPVKEYVSRVSLVMFLG